MRNVIIFTLITVVLFSCITNTPNNKPTSNQINPFDNNDWTSKLERDTSEMKKAWLGFADPFEFSKKEFKDMGLNIFVEGEDPSRMKVIPIPNYRISYQKIMSWNGRDQIESLMELSKTTADCYIVNGHDFKCLVNFEMKNNVWNPVGWGPLDKKIVAKLSSIYFDKKEKTIIIHVETSNDTKPYQRTYITYTENGQYLQIDNFGNTTSLVNTFIEFQKNTKAGVEW
jgi:hypothetical protein